MLFGRLRLRHQHIVDGGFPALFELLGPGPARSIALLPSTACQQRAAAWSRACIDVQVDPAMLAACLSHT